MSNVVLGDWTTNNLPDKSIDVIMADPPYFEVKGEFDFIWKDFEAYLKDVEKWAVECKRVLKDNGSLFWWGMDMKISYSQIILDKYFDLKNVLKWNKKSAANQWDSRRNFPEITAEHCLFYTLGDDRTGLEVVTEKYIKPNNKFAKYLRDIIYSNKLNNKSISKLYPSKTGGLTGCVSNWLNGDNVMTAEQYELLQGNFPMFNKSYSDHIKEYNLLRDEYSKEVKKIESERRIFNNIHNLKDLIEMPREVNKYFNHPTKKSLRIQKMLIETVTNKQSTVLIPFGGSGTDVEACIDLGLEYICYEIDPKHYKTIKAREKECLKQPSLF
jgi:site-specific DNA-methyltransferase (adenine-specific)